MFGDSGTPSKLERAFNRADMGLGMKSDVRESIAPVDARGFTKVFRDGDDVDFQALRTPGESTSHRLVLFRDERGEGLGVETIPLVV